MYETIHVIAYAFKSKLSFDEIFERLNTVTPWHWVERDSDTWGRYFSTRAREDYAMVKVFEEDGGYAVNIKYKSSLPDAETDWNALHSQIVHDVLPSLDAYAVVRTEDYE